MRFFIKTILVLGLASLPAGCSKNDEPPPPQPTQQSSDTNAQQPAMPVPAASSHSTTPTAPAPSTEAAPASIAGVRWTVPAEWLAQPPRTMRVATYTIPRSAGDSEDAECAVFYFGTGQGGDVQSNIARWVGQFQTTAPPEQSTNDVNGIKVTLVKISGSYAAPSGPMMQSQGMKPNYRLLGAIVEAPEGAVFFKTTGPAATITASEKQFATLVESIQKQ